VVRKNLNRSASQNKSAGQRQHKMKNSEIYSAITEKIIANLETAGSWAKLWQVPSPISLNGHYYTGINRLVLSSDKYDIPVYGTFQQIRANGGQVRKGEKATLVIFWKKLLIHDEDKKEDKITFMLRNYFVFNVSQADFDELGKKHIDKLILKVEATNNMRNSDADSVINSMPSPPSITYSNSDDRAYYAPSSDSVSVPDIKYFNNSEAFYATLFHELTHSTGHPSRLDRFEKGSQRFGSVSYSKEELVAELGASFLCAVCSINSDIANAAAYIAGWSRALRDNTNWIVWAAARAELAVNFILNEATVPVEAAA
jgi:antirestriction protein ArdC